MPHTNRFRNGDGTKNRGKSGLSIALGRRLFANIVYVTIDPMIVLPLSLGARSIDRYKRATFTGTTVDARVQIMPEPQENESDGHAQNFNFFLRTV